MQAEVCLRRVGITADPPIDVVRRNARCYPNVRALNRTSDFQTPGWGSKSLVVRLWCVTEATVVKRRLATVVCLA